MGVIALLVASCLAAAPAATVPAGGERIAELVARLLDRELREAARNELVAMGPAATPAALELRRSPQVPLRWEAATILGRTRDPRGVEPLVEDVLRDASEHVKWRATWALDQHAGAPRERAVELLRAGLAGDDPTVTWRSAVALAYLGVPDGLPVLHDGLGRSDELSRWEAVHALGRVHDATTVGRLEAIVATGTPRERDEAILVLGRIGTPDVVPALLGAARHASPDVRWRACLALGRIRGDERVIAALRSASESDPDERVRERAARALARAARPAGAGRPGEDEAEAGDDAGDGPR